MSRCAVAQSSVTYAMKVKRLLSSRSIPSSVIKLNPSQTANGCGYGVEFNCIYYNTVITLLQSAGIKYSDVSR